MISIVLLDAVAKRAKRDGFVNVARIESRLEEEYRLEDGNVEGHGGEETSRDEGNKKARGRWAKEAHCG